MKVTYKVISNITGNDLTDKAMWVLRPNGELAFNNYGDLIGDECAEAVFTIDSTGTWTRYSATMMECSECKQHVPYHRYTYCPHCASKNKLV